MVTLAESGAYSVGAIAAVTGGGGTGVSIQMAVATSADSYPVLQL